MATELQLAVRVHPLTFRLQGLASFNGSPACFSHRNLNQKSINELLLINPPKPLCSPTQKLSEKSCEIKAAEGLINIVGVAI